MNLTENFYKDICDPITLVTSNSALTAITLFEKTVEIIGIVETVDSSIQNLFKFVLINGENSKIQVLAWGKEASRVQGYIKINFVTHIDGGFAKKRNPLHSLGNITYDIHIMSNTVVNVLSVHRNPDAVVTAIPNISLEDVMNVQGTIVVKGHLNNKIEILQLASGGKVGQTCLVESKYKLEIRIQNYSNDCNFKENSHVEITGKIFNNGIPYLLVDNIKDIKILSDLKLTQLQLLQGTKIPKRKSEEEIELTKKTLKIDNENADEK